MDVLPSHNESPCLEIMSEPCCGLELTPPKVWPT